MEDDKITIPSKAEIFGSDFNFEEFKNNKIKSEKLQADAHKILEEKMLISEYKQLVQLIIDDLKNLNNCNNGIYSKRIDFNLKYQYQRKLSKNLMKQLKNDFSQAGYEVYYLGDIIFIVISDSNPKLIMLQCSILKDHTIADYISGWIILIALFAYFMYCYKSNNVIDPAFDNMVHYCSLILLIPVILAMTLKFLNIFISIFSFYMNNYYKCKK